MKIKLYSSILSEVGRRRQQKPMPKETIIYEWTENRLPKKIRMNIEGWGGGTSSQSIS